MERASVLTDQDRAGLECCGFGWAKGSLSSSAKKSAGARRISVSPMPKWPQIRLSVLLEGKWAPLRYLLNCCRLIPISRQTFAIEGSLSQGFRRLREKARPISGTMFMVPTACGQAARAAGGIAAQQEECRPVRGAPWRDIER